MKKLDSWAVAAAILLREDGYLNYNTLTEMVIRTELTSLGLKGKTPERTLRTILGTKEVDGQPIFSAYRDGDYTIADREFVQTLPLVQMAIQGLDESPSCDRNPDVTTTRFIHLVDERNRLRSRNRLLEAKLKQITDICHSTENAEPEN